MGRKRRRQKSEHTKLYQSNLVDMEALNSAAKDGFYVDHRTGFVFGHTKRTEHGTYYRRLPWGLEDFSTRRLSDEEIRQRIHQGHYIYPENFGLTRSQIDSAKSSAPGSLVERILGIGKTKRLENERRLQERVRSYQEAVRKSLKRLCDIEAEKEKVEAEEKARSLRQSRGDFWLALDGHAFEKELAKVYEANGYEVRLTPISGDDGADIIARRDGRTLVIQCKAHARPIGPGAVRELNGVIDHFRADEGILAAPGGFSKSAMDFAIGKRIRLLGLDEIIGMTKPHLGP